jgi:hypothetical protein
MGEGGGDDILGILLAHLHLQVGHGRRFAVGHVRLPSRPLTALHHRNKPLGSVINQSRHSSTR